MSESKVAEESVEIKDAQSERIAQLEGQVKQLMEMLSMQMSQKPVVAASPMTQTVKIIHLVERAPGLKTLIELSNLTIVLRTFGEERNLTLSQFEELIGKYRRWFNKGIIGIHADSESIAEQYGLDTVSNYPIDNEFISELGSKTMDQIEAIYPRLPEAGKESLVSYWVRKARAGDKKFADIRKLEVLNRLTDGSVSQLIAELNAKSAKNK